MKSQKFSRIGCTLQSLLLDYPATCLHIVFSPRIGPPSKVYGLTTPPSYKLRGTAMAALPVCSRVGPSQGHPQQTRTTENYAWRGPHCRITDTQTRTLSPTNFASSILLPTTTQKQIPSPTVTNLHHQPSSDTEAKCSPLSKKR